jgi:Squalene-hopene cyclase C-terminal domain/Prenyltransferase and squalene oxidase repeat
MVNDWREQLKHDPLPPLLSSSDEALVYFVRRDLLGEDPGPVERLWSLPGAQKLLKKQLPDGSWPRAGELKHPAINYRLVETWRNLRYLVEVYGCTRVHPQTQAAAEYIFSCQTEDGDIRGILANQYATYYTGAILALLVQAGYQGDPRVEKGLQWLLAMRQDDGGWSIPLITYKLDRATQYRLTTQFVEPLQPDRSKPFVHYATGMILRAFAVHPLYRTSEAARAAANLLKSRFFQPDSTSSLQDATYWVRFEYPFWWNNLVAALDSLSRMDYSAGDGQIQSALHWLVEHQEASGLWRISYIHPEEGEKSTAKVQAMKRWVTLAICRLLSRFY